MKEMKESMLAKRGDKGFTLMEMLIVVAIIAILVAIAIPIFNTQLDNARKAVDQANMRSVESEAVTTAMSTSITSATTYYGIKTGDSISVATSKTGATGYNQTTQGAIAAGAGIVQVSVTTGYVPTASWVSAS